MAGSGGSVRGVLRFNRKHYPMYFKLYDHTNLVACISADNEREHIDIQNMVKAANDQCEHWSKVGKCLEIKPATLSEWMDMH